MSKKYGEMDEEMFQSSKLRKMDENGIRSQDKFAEWISQTKLKFVISLWFI